MASVFDKLLNKGLIHPPHFLENNIIYEVTDKSDFDIYGVGIPSKEIIFPHLGGNILGFGRQVQKFEQFQQHHIDYPSLANPDKQYDITIFNIVRYFHLLMENNPNIIDTIFVPQDCVVHINAIGSIIRENRRLFLHKGSYHKFLGYAHSQLNKMGSVNRTGKRQAIYEEHGFDVKFATHLVRLSYECEQILSEHDLDLRRNSEHLKAIRRGDVSEEGIRVWFASKEQHLQKLYETSTLRNTPDEPTIKSLLLKCLEHHFGSLDKCVLVDSESAMKRMLNEIQKTIYEGRNYL
jgi:predicted nucleotidyltransferase